MILPIADNLFLEQIAPKHAAGLYNIAAANRHHLREWLPWVDRMQSVKFMHDFVTACVQRNKAGNELAFVILYENIIVGRIGVYKIDAYNKIGEIGYWLGQHAEGKGIMSRSCKILMAHCFDTLNLNRIEIKCGTENLKSQKIPEKLGFTLEGIIRQGEWLHDSFIDLNLYSFLKMKEHRY